MTGKIHVEVAKWLVFHLIKRDTHEFIHGKRMCFLLAPLKKQLSYPGKVIVCSLVGIIIGSTGPQGFFVATVRKNDWSRGS